MKKATLLIKELDKIYTMESRNRECLILKNASIAFHHQEILYVGEKLPAALLDKDTRIIEGKGRIALPAFLECRMRAPVFHTFDEERSFRSFLTSCAHRATMTFGMENAQRRLEDIEWECVPAKEGTLPVCCFDDLIRKKKSWRKQRFCISGYDAHCINMTQLFVARLLYAQGLDELTLLKALTLYPAKELSLQKKGKIKRGMEGDVVLVRASSAAMLFADHDDRRITHRIKSGVCVFPHLLI